MLLREMPLSTRLRCETGNSPRPDFLRRRTDDEHRTTAHEAARAYPAYVDRRLWGGKSRRCAVLRIVAGGRGGPTLLREFADPITSVS